MLLNALRVLLLYFELMRDSLAIFQPTTVSFADALICTFEPGLTRVRYDETKIKLCNS
jgi:hypothetical protein